MSLATRCPACGTTFRIEPEQLALADSWARCGRCSTVFDAAAQQRPGSADDAAPVPVSAQSFATATTPARETTSAPNAVDAFDAALLDFRADLPPSASSSRSREDDAADPSGDLPEPGDASPEPSTPDGTLSPSAPPTPPAFDPWRELPSLSLGSNPAASAPVQATVDRPVDPTVADDAPVPDAQAAQPPTPETSPAQSPLSPDPLWPVSASGSTGPVSGPSGIRPAARAESVAPTGVIHAASEPVDEGGAGTRKPHGAGRRRSWRLAMLLLAIALLVALLAQALYRQRDAVAARRPALRPMLATLCDVAGCTIAPLRRPGDIAIEGASFAHAQDSDRYRLVFALRNQADVPLAMPAIELSLLDAQERAVVRRVLMPGEFGAAQATLPALAEHAGAVSFALDGDATGGGEPLPRIAGYAMVAFYP